MVSSFSGKGFKGYVHLSKSCELDCLLQIHFISFTRHLLNVDVLLTSALTIVARNSMTDKSISRSGIRRTVGGSKLSCEVVDSCHRLIALDLHVTCL